MTASAFQEEAVTVSKNIYKRVVGGAAAGTDFVIVDDDVNFAKFGIGDTVLIIQMKGAQILVPENGTYGNLQNITGTPGKYEFLIVESTEPATRKITFTNNLLNNYNVNSDVQLVWVPSYYSARVDANLTCPPWDSLTKTGGVLTMIVGKTLTLNANIDVSAKGFSGGTTVAGLGKCIETDNINLNRFAYDAAFGNSGYKGEGVVSKAYLGPLVQDPIFPGYGKGKGANFNGGGGGNGRFSGGGGGSNYGAGGKGGRESTDICTTAEDGGLGGKQIKLTALQGGIYLGGGGGGSTFSGGGTATSGGKGGGIIIMLCGDVIGNNHSISADGESPALTASGTGGAGGGGAGGSIAIYLESFSTASNLTISAKGGKGGNNSGNFGEGGGGGGGLIWINSITVPGNVLRKVDGGAGGTRSGGVTAGTNGASGESLTSFLPILNGFLFNTIRSSVTNDLTDSICSDNIPYPVYGTKPIGGSGSYTYLWQRRNDSGGSPAIIAGSNVQNYSFSAVEADTFEIRRIVSDDVTSLTDTSKWAKLVVQPKILNNTVNIYSDIISLTDTICWNGDPKLVNQVMPDLVVPTTKHLLYIWQDSTQTATWGTTVGTLKSYDPPAGLQKTKWYRRKVTSGRCTDSTAIVKVHVLDTISRNIITSRFDTICHGGTFVDLNVDPGLGGGDNTYRYLWQYSQTGVSGTWSTAPGASTNSTYNPDEASTFYPGKLYYRRKVFSGIHNVCIDSGKAAIRVDWPVITVNNIAADETICSGSNPTAVTGAEPLNGAGPGTFLYTWQDSSKFHNWTNITGFVKVSGIGYAPPVLTDTTKYRRIAYSSKCSDISKPVIKRVHKPITNYNISLLSGTWDTTICSKATPRSLDGFKPGAASGTSNPANNIYQWITSSVKSGGYSDIAGANSEDYQPGSLVNSTASPAYVYYRRKVTNGMCSVTSDSAVAVKVLPKISNNIVTADQAICYNTIPAALNGPALTGGDGTPAWLWQQSINTGTTWTSAVNDPDKQNYSPPALTVPTKYRRLIFSGPFACCKDTSNTLSISINPLPVGTITAAIDTICEGPGGNPVNIQITGSTASPWSVVYKENSTNKPSVLLNNTNSTVQVTPVITGSTTDSTSFIYKLVSIQDNLGCFATNMTGSRKLVVFKVPVAGAGADDEVCGPAYKLTGTKNVGSGKWSYPGVPVLNSTPGGDNLTVTVDLPYTPKPWSHKYRFYWKVNNWKCKASDSVDITFYLKPDSAIAGEDDNFYSLDKEIVLPVGTPTVGEGSWNVISGSAEPKPDNDSTFINLSAGENVFEWKIITKENLNCISADQVTYTVYDLKVPDAFSPNGDLVNDEFEIKGLDIENSNITLTILNSAGTEIYRTSNINDTYTAWNGGSKSGPVPDGTYYYLLIIESIRNESMLKKSGFIILKRDRIQ